MVERSWAQFFNEKIIDSNSERAFKGILHFCVTGFTISGDILKLQKFTFQREGCNLE